MSEATTRHLDEGEIMRAAAGGLTDQIAAAHLNSCEECRRSVEEWAQTRAFFEAVRETRYVAEPGAEACPSDEELANFAAESGAADERIARHVLDCCRCAAVLRDAADAASEPEESAVRVALSTGSAKWRAGMAEAFAGKERKQPRRFVLYAAAAAILLVTAGGAGLWWNMQRANDPARLLAKAYTAARPFEFRLRDDGYGPIRQERGMGSAFGRPEPLVAAETEIRRRLAKDPASASALGLKGRAELMEGDYESAIKSLTLARDAKAAADAELLADLGTAYAVRGDAEKRNIDFGHAVQLYLESLKKNPGEQQVLFNLALTYERLWLVTEAADTWRKLLDLKPAAEWRHEAEAHLAAMQKLERERRGRGAAVLKDPAAFVAKNEAADDWNPESYLDVFWTDWLPGATEEPKRKAAEAVAQRMKSGFGDASLADAMQARTQAVEGALGDLAAAIRANQKGQADVALQIARKAERGLRAAEQNVPAMKARLEVAYALQRSAMNAECARIAAEVAAAADERKYAWIGARAHLQHAGCGDALARPGPARAEIERVAHGLEGSGLGQTYLLALGFVAGLDDITGNAVPLWDNAPKGLQRYWNSDASAYRAQQFQFDLKNAASLLGWRDCAIVLARAALTSLEGLANPDMEAINRMKLAALLSEPEERWQRQKELQQAERLATQLAAGPAREHVEWVLTLARANTLMSEGKAREAEAEAARLTAASDRLSSADRTQVQVIRGEALFRLENWTQAAVAFRRAIELNQARAATLQSAMERVTELDTAGTAYRELTQIELLQEKNPAKALRTWRLYRGEKEDVAAVDAPVITYAVLPAGVAVWLENGSEVSARVVSEPKENIEAVARRMVDDCASPSSEESAIQAEGRKLFEWLLAPEVRGRQSGRFVLRTDSWVSGIPFGALTDHAGKYLNSSSVFGELTEPDGSGWRSAGVTADVSAVIVSAPKAVGPGRGNLPVLTGSIQETADLAARFRKPVLLQGETADAEGLADAAPQAGLFHFSGHGWSNAGNGALILPAGTKGEARFVTAREFSRQDWRRCSLAVLSACLTGVGETHEAINPQSLVRGLLSAGAHRVVAARWNVDSEATRELMNGFYERLFAGENEVAALAASARAVSTTAHRSHPYYWGGFQVFGRF